MLDTDSKDWLKSEAHHNNQIDMDNSKILPDMGTGVLLDSMILKKNEIVD